MKRIARFFYTVYLLPTTDHIFPVRTNTTERNIRPAHRPQRHVGTGIEQHGCSDSCDSPAASFERFYDFRASIVPSDNACRILLLRALMKADDFSFQTSHSSTFCGKANELEKSFFPIKTSTAV